MHLAPWTLLCAALLCASDARGQATLRPVPRVAHAWTSTEAPRLSSEPGSRAVPASYDLEFIGPPRAAARPLPAQPAPEEDDGRFVELDLWAGAVAGSSFTDAPGEIASQRAGWRAAFGRYTPSGTSYAVEVATEGAFYDFGGGASPVAGVSDPFNDVYDTSLAGRFLFRDSERLEVYGGATVGLAGEDRAELSDSVYVGGALALRYAAAPEFALLAGVAGLSRFEDSPWVLPYVGFDWRMSEEVRLLVEAAQVNLEWRASEAWTLGAVAAYDFHQYRLNDEGPLHGGAFRDEEIRAGLSATWRARPAVELELELGKLLWREARFSDGASGLSTEAETGSPFYLRLGLSAGF